MQQRIVRRLPVLERRIQPSGIQPHHQQLKNIHVHIFKPYALARRLQERSRQRGAKVRRLRRQEGGMQEEARRLVRGADEYLRRGGEVVAVRSDGLHVSFIGSRAVRDGGCRGGRTVTPLLAMRTHLKDRGGEPLTVYGGGNVVGMRVILLSIISSRCEAS